MLSLLILKLSRLFPSVSYSLNIKCSQRLNEQCPHLLNLYVLTVTEQSTPPLWMYPSSVLFLLHSRPTCSIAPGPLHLAIPAGTSNPTCYKWKSLLFSLLPPFTLKACFSVLNMHLDEHHCPTDQAKNQSFPRLFIIPKSPCLTNHQIGLLFVLGMAIILSCGNYFVHTPQPLHAVNPSFRAFPSRI